jgi:hypothetical protein
MGYHSSQYSAKDDTKTPCFVIVPIAVVSLLSGGLLRLLELPFPDFLWPLERATLGLHEMRIKDLVRPLQTNESKPRTAKGQTVIRTCDNLELKVRVKCRKVAVQLEAGLGNQDFPLRRHQTFSTSPALLRQNFCPRVCRFDAR